MRTLLTLGFVAALTTACADDGVAGGCTAMGSPSGIDIHLDPAMVPKVDSGTFDVCWDGACHEYAIDFNGQPETFADVPGLPAGEVEVTVRLVDRSGAEVLDRTLSVTPVPTYPNGHSCPPDGARVLLLVDARGALRAATPRFA